MLQKKRGKNADSAKVPVDKILNSVGKPNIESIYSYGGARVGLPYSYEGSNVIAQNELQTKGAFLF